MNPTDRHHRLRALQYTIATLTLLSLALAGAFAWNAHEERREFEHAVKRTSATLAWDRVFRPMVAAHYGEGDGLEGRPMANGQPMDPLAFTTAHRTFRMGTRLEVTRGNRSVEVEVTDRGPYDRDASGAYRKDLDLSAAAFTKLADPAAGVIRVRVRRLP